MRVQQLNIRRLVLPLAGSGLLLLAGCGGGGSGTSGAGTSGSASSTSGTAACSGSCGGVLTTLTDAPGDFISYVVNVDSLQLQQKNGASVQTLPAAATVDFAQLVNLTELINAGQVPAGNYTSIVLTLDYSNAQITAQDSSGNPVTLKPVDGTGAAISGTVQVTVTLDGSHPLVITPGSTGRLALDFNLAASDTVNLTSDTVTVSPTLGAGVQFSNTKPVRVRGSLVSGSTSSADFVLNVEPFWSQASTGQETVDVTATTTYQVSGTAYVGTAGLTALAALPAGTMVAAFGTLDTSGSSPTFTATSVVAGTSLQSTSQDEVSGTVVARSGDTLTLSSATWSKPMGFYGGFMRTASVTVGTATVVTEEGGTGTYTIADISVGQHVDVFGTASQGMGGSSGSGMGSAAAGSATASLDATSGEVNLDLTPAWGMVSSLTAASGSTGGSLTLNLMSLDGLPVSAFTFTGTGTAATAASGSGSSAPGSAPAPSNDANPAAYVVDTGSLSQSGLAQNAPARVFGFVAPFGSAPPDFVATTLVNYSAVTDYLNVGWGWSGSTTAFTGLTSASTSLALNLANVGWQHAIQVGPENLDLTKLPSPPAIVASSDQDVYTIGHAGKFQVENFNSFTAFITQLSSELTGSTGVIFVNAAGSYDSGTNTFAADSVAVLLTQ